MAENDPGQDPNALQQLMFAFLKSALLRTAIDLELFTHIAHGQKTPSALASAAGADERGVRIVADALSAIGLLTKSAGEYALPPLVEMMLVKLEQGYGRFEAAEASSDDHDPREVALMNLHNG